MSTVRRKIENFTALDGGVDEYHPESKKKNNRLRGEGKTHDVWIKDSSILIRPGRTLYGPPLYDNCYGLDEYVDPDGNARLLIAGKQSVLEVGALAFTVRDSGLTQEHLHFTNHRGRCFYNGAETQRKITGTTAARIGIVAPTTDPTLAESGTGLTGDFGFKYTFVIKVDGVKIWESNPSDAASISVTNKSVIVTVAVSGDTRVNCRRIYRTSASGTLYQEDGDIDNNTGTTYTSSQADALLGRIVEENHGVPVQGIVSEGCNERMYWLVNADSKARLYWSEAAETEPYIEYQQSVNYKELPSDGLGVWLKSMYNPNTYRDDLFIGQESGIHVLPSGNPFNPLGTLSTEIGGAQHDTVKEYNGSIYFLSNKKIVYQILGGRLIDLTSRNIPKSMKNLQDITTCRGGIIFDRYYVFTAKSTIGHKYSNVMWVCDTKTIKEVENGYANAVWFVLNVPFSYILQRNDGTVLAFNEEIARLEQLSFANKQDQYGDCFFSQAEKPVRISGKFTGLTGSQTIALSIYAAVTGGVALWTESHTVVIAADGTWSLSVGQQSIIPDSVITGMAAGTAYCLEITANSETFSPRKSIPLRAFLNNKITSATYSMIFTASDIEAQFATKFFGGENPSARRLATLMRVSGKQQRGISVTPVYRDFYQVDGQESDLERDQGGVVMVDGVNVWGSPTTQIAMNMDEPLEPGNGGAVSFVFNKTGNDEYFDFEGLQHHYTELQRF